MQDKETREAFERHLIANGGWKQYDFKREADGEYEDALASDSWELWQAAQAPLLARVRELEGALASVPPNETPALMKLRADLRQCMASLSDILEPCLVKHNGRETWELANLDLNDLDAARITLAHLAKYGEAK